ncbi:pentatricopeptide repeat-containing protein At3g62890-like [Cucurbita moschata]|uniref:Pentatricopeptide repeat-containing protein At3g62890-like n=1 Tax=Cucurbita moschata TaxID=3662 RepID=A0A6J1E4B5_CUCMO|nr:pentatricopeptide repeat-containing protein At3g62890-like [Cucurbita moschata]
MLNGIRLSIFIPNPNRLLFRILHSYLGSSHIDIAPPPSSPPFKCSISPRSLSATLRNLLQPLSAPDPPPILSYASVFQFLTGQNLLKLGQQVHAHMLLRGLEPTALVGSKMVAFYASSGDIDSSVAVFNRISEPSSLLFNSMIRAYARYGFAERTVATYFSMHSWGFTGDYFTFPFVLKSSVDLLSVWMGKCVHGLVLRAGLEFDLYVATSLIDMYGKCGEINDARKVFDKMTVRDVSSWNALLAGYMKGGFIDAAVAIFERMPWRNIVSWTTMISGYSQSGLAQQALSLFDEMLKEDSGVRPNWVTIMSVLPACAQSSALERGRRIHELACRMGLNSNASVLIALTAMYAKCGSLADARNCFNRLNRSEKSLVAWNTMITAYASYGHGREAVSTFQEMIEAGIRPDDITFTGLLSACSHSGLVDIGLNYFNYMSTTYSTNPRAEHYACVVDLLGRAGRLAEASKLVDEMPMPAGPSIWGSLLAACRKYRNLEMAETAARKLFVLEPENTGNYVLLSNMYAEAGRWQEVDKLRAILISQGTKKSPGCSWIEVNGIAHMFLGGDTSHPQTKEIYMFLEALPEKMKAAGYTPDTSFVLHDISEEEKEFNLIAHSEKLAVAFGILNTPSETVLRVTKNLRICGDCHTAMVFISEIYGREVVVRDVNRFHHFKAGSCSCGDYW